MSRRDDPGRCADQTDLIAQMLSGAASGDAPVDAVVEVILDRYAPITGRQEWSRRP
jgi:hypothetical protein